MEPVFNRVPGSGPADNNFGIYDPEFLIDGIAYFTAQHPGDVTSYASGDPRDPFLDVFHVWNNTSYHITGLTLEIIGTATDSENRRTIVRGPANAVWGDVNGDGEVGLSDIFRTIIVSSDGNTIRFEDGLLPIGGRFTDIHLAMSDNPPDFAGIDSTFTGVFVPGGGRTRGLQASGVGAAVPEPTTCILLALSITGLTVISKRRSPHVDSPLSRPASTRSEAGAPIGSAAATESRLASAACQSGTPASE